MPNRLEEIEAEYARNGRLSRRSIVDLRTLILDGDSYTAISTAADCGVFEAEEEIARSLDSEDPMVRWIAAATLFTRFRLSAFAGRCLEFAREDPDSMVRNISLSGLGELLPYVKDLSLKRSMAQFLLEVLNKSDDKVDQAAAYNGILAAMDVLPADRPSPKALFEGKQPFDPKLVARFADAYDAS
jgi:hypothetical protein